MHTKPFGSLQVWFVTGSQHLYGEQTLKAVAQNASAIARGLDQSEDISVSVRCKDVVTTPDAIYQLCVEANSFDQCVGIVFWMHTFSPAKLCINGLQILQKPFVHLHTQFNRDIPWNSIDMDFMNLHQSAHGDREFGFIATRLRKARTVVVGHWQEQKVHRRIGDWARAACGFHALKHTRVARIGDNMREVAVTEGDKVAAQMQFGYSVNGFGIGELVSHIRTVTDRQGREVLAEYKKNYTFSDSARAQEDALLREAKIELGLENFLHSTGCNAFTDTFEDLHGIEQLPGLSVQRLMQKGYGFGAEGDWKTAALLRAMKVMASGLSKGTSFMEDYTYHLHPDGAQVLGAHMLEVCPSIAQSTPTVHVHPLGIGGKKDPVRLVFTGAAGPAIQVSVVDMGNRFRMIVNVVQAHTPKEQMPKLPVARVLWHPQPNLDIAATGWILAGGAHHTVYSQALTVQHMIDFSEMCDIELITLDESTNIESLKSLLRNNEVYYQLQKGYVA